MIVLWTLPFLVGFAVGVLLYHLGSDPFAGDTLLVVFLPVWIWCTFTISTKRFHDLNHSAWWNLLLLIPIIGFFIWLLILGLAPGRVPNHYGDVR